MAQSLDLTVDVYRLFLDKIKKEYTAIVPPAVFNRTANEAQEIWLADKIKEVERDQKRIDDIRVIRVSPVSTINVISTTTVGGTIRRFPLPDGISVHDAIFTASGHLPMYHRFLRVAFKLQYVNNECCVTGISDWIQNVHVMRSDQYNWVMSSPRRKPNDKKLYYEIRGNSVYVITGTSSYATQMQLDYVRPPRMIFFDSTNPNVEDATLSYTAGAGCINIEFPEDQKREILDVMVRTFLERVQDVRYQTWLNEEAMKFQAK